MLGVSTHEERLLWLRYLLGVFGDRFKISEFGGKPLRLEPLGVESDEFPDDDDDEGLASVGGEAADDEDDE